ncbi:MAG: translesion error-prone DNA polymerase V autoproteolytic subunit [Formivibrio sp.]|nr:translesion error-prone DNA polymerase V autoproteolytic subunit [Formivibrio sp.]
MPCFLPGPTPAQLDPLIHLIPLMEVPVPAGFPSPAEDWVEDRVDLNQRFVRHPEATFFFRVSGDSMVSPNPERTILNGATLIVDRAREVKHDDIVVAIIEGEFTVKRLYRRGDKLALIAENTSYPPLVLGEAQELNVWGVVTAWIVQPR